MKTAWVTIRILVCVVAIAATGCSTTGKGPADSSPPASGAASVAPSAAPVWPAGAPDAWLLVGKAKEPGVRVIQASTGESFLDMPSGAAGRPDWGRAIVATAAGAKTIVQDLVVQPGPNGPEIAIDGAWRLPTIGYDPTPVGISADGSTAVLVEPDDASAEPRAVSRFAILSVVPLQGPPRIVELRGWYDYDAISANGRVLYVVEHLPGEVGRYQVRAIDLPAGTMRDTIIADKRNLEEAMAGWPIAQLRAPDGMVFTLYRGLEHPFIHTLNTAEAWAVCIDLPAERAGDKEAALHWGLAASSDWRSLYAANAEVGLVSEVDVTELTIRRSVSVGSVADASQSLVAGAPAITLAKFGHAVGGPVGRRTVVAPDGATAYAAGPDGILAIGTSDLKVRARLLDGSSVDALGLTRDGRAIFALLRDGGRIVVVDGATGVVLAQVPGDGFDRLLAVVPY
jgi:hypothetical protein